MKDLTAYTGMRKETLMCVQVHGKEYETRKPKKTEK